MVIAIKDVKKFAVTVSGPLMVTVVELLLELATLPVQPVNEYPNDRGRGDRHGRARRRRIRSPV